MNSKICVGVIMALLLVMAMLTGCGEQDQKEERNMDLIRKNWYGADLMFDYLMLIGDERVITGGSIAQLFIDPIQRFYDPFYTDLVFVHTEAEAQDFPDNIIVAWPTMRIGEGWDTPISYGLIAGIHWAVNQDEAGLMHRGQLIRDPLSLEDFGLSYPITIADLVDNWQKVNELWNALTNAEHATIHRAAPAGGPRDVTGDNR